MYVTTVHLLRVCMYVHTYDHDIRAHTECSDPPIAGPSRMFGSPIWYLVWDLTPWPPWRSGSLAGDCRTPFTPTIARYFSELCIWHLASLVFLAIPYQQLKKNDAYDW